MRITIGTVRLDRPGGSESYVLTIGEHLARLGHRVTLIARDLGMVAALARERGLTALASDDPDARSVEADAVVVLDRPLAVELAGRHPHAARVFVCHNIDEIYLPPPLEGVVHATVALNQRFETVVRGCAGAGEVVRMSQPIDVRRFSPRGIPSDSPRRALLLGNYHSSHRGRSGELREAWTDAGIEWRELGGERASTAVAEAIGEVDLVVGYGRAILEAMACGRPAYVHDHVGSDGWVTPEAYTRMEADGFAGFATRTTPDPATLRADLDLYRPELGRTGQDLIRAKHDARLHAAELVGLIERVEARPPPAEPSALEAIRNLSEALMRAEATAETYRLELHASRTEEHRARVELHEAMVALHDSRVHASEVQRRGQEHAEALQRRRRYRLADLLARPLERWRARRR